MLGKLGSFGCASLAQVINSELYIRTGSLFMTCLIDCFIVAMPFLFTIMYVILDYKYRDKYLRVNEMQASEVAGCSEEEVIIKEVKYPEPIEELENEENENLMPPVQTITPTQDAPPVEKRTKSIFTQMSLEYWLLILISITLLEAYGVFQMFSTNFFMERYTLSYKLASKQSALLGALSVAFVVISAIFAEKYGKLG